MKTKVCRDCGQERPETKFPLYKGERRGRCLGCPTPRTLKSEEHKQAVRAYHIHRTQMKRFGLTPEQYEDLLVEQGGRCAICGDTPDDRRLAVDHDHACCPGSNSCGECIRGLLCTRCNIALGCFRDNPKYLEAAIAYLGEKE